MAKRFSKTLHVKEEHLDSKQRVPADSQQANVR